MDRHKRRKCPIKIEIGIEIEIENPPPYAGRGQRNHDKGNPTIPVRSGFNPDGE